ncbi:hypothetical protein A0H81_03061 [Grifola frondosa]|uniref:Uncharacterized protein n=1 Tax=Grifola frondosa TaxID=5627 RepID=A0A1C7MMX9_GRIFR|nr:hypothetical protein A0H81_03061 [Grifola frondosa]
MSNRRGKRCYLQDVVIYFVSTTYPRFITTCGAHADRPAYTPFQRLPHWIVMSHQLDERGRTEYPFPVMDAVEPSSSSSNSLTSRSRTSNSRSRRSSPSTLSRHRSRVERDGDNVQRSRSPSAHYRASGGRNRRADEAERRVVETLRRLRSAHEATMLAQADAARASEELRQYKYRLEEAQREIHKAQEILNQIEQEKAELEAEAARARSTARKYREERLMARAREEGRQDGYQEGFSRGKNLSYQEARATTQARGRDLNRRMTEGEDEEETESGDGDYNRRSPVPIPVRRDIRPPSQPIWRPPSRPINSRASQRSPPHVSDVAPHAAILPPPRDSGSQRKTSVAGRTTREDRRPGLPVKRFRDRTSGGSGGIPEIVVESPTTATSSRSSTTVTVTQPHLLSPELTQTPLYAPQDVMVMSVEVPQTYYGIPLENRQLTPLSGLNLATPGLLSTLPPGFSPI